MCVRVIGLGCKISHIQNSPSSYLPDDDGQTLLGNLLITQLTYSRFKLFLSSQSILKSSLYIGCSNLCHGDMTHRMNTCSRGSHVKSGQWMDWPHSRPLANNVVPGPVRLSPSETFNVRQRGDAEWVNWGWDTEKAAEESWSSRNRD